MLLLNFSHPLTDAHLAQLAELLGEPPAAPIGRMAQFDVARPFDEQVRELVDSVGLSPVQWQTERIIINPPGLAVITAALLAELHGRMGYFPTIIRLRTIAGATPPVYEVAELINLQAIRETARLARQATG